MSLTDRIKTGPTHEPLRVLLHGVEGVGKTTFAAGAPGAVFLGPEDGGGDLDIHRITVGSWADTLSAVQELTHEEHPYRVLVLDTVDFVERLCHQHITKGSGSLEKVEGGYGKGYKIAAEELAKFLQALDVLRTRRRMAIIGLAHTSIVKFDDPTEAAYDRYQPRMHKDAAGLWMGWADCVLFANYDIKVRVAAGGTAPEILKKGKAIDRAPDRLIYTERRPAFDAKNRYRLPFEIPLSWPAFAEAIQWDRRDADARNAPSRSSAAPTAEDVRAAMEAAGRRGWTKSALVAALDSYGVSRGSDIRPEHRAGFVALLAGAPLNPNDSTTEAK